MSFEAERFYHCNLLVFANIRLLPFCFFVYIKELKVSKIYYTIVIACQSKVKMSGPRPEPSSSSGLATLHRPRHRLPSPNGPGAGILPNKIFYFWQEPL